MQTHNDVDRNFYLAVWTGDLERLRKLIATYGLSYTLTSENGCSYLCEAISSKKAHVAKFLIASGAQVNSQFSYSPLHLAAAMGDIEMVKILVNRQVDVNQKYKISETPLHSAICAQKTEVADFLLKHGACPNARDNDGLSLLHVAVKMHWLDMAENLIKHGANVNCVLPYKKIQKGGCTDKKYAPLHVAAENGAIEMLKLLLKRGAFINVRTDHGDTSLILAAEKGYKHVVEYLLNHGAEINLCARDYSTPLSVAIKNGHSTVVEMLLLRGAKIDTLDENGKSILHLAVEKGVFAIVEMVLKYFPVKNDKDILGVAMNSWGKENKMITDALFKNGMTVNPENVNSGLLLAAVKKSYLQIVKEVLKYAESISEERCIHLSSSTVMEKQKKVAACKNSFNINAKDSFGNPSLYYAVESGNLEMTKLLLAHKASAKAFPNLLHSAVNNNCSEIAELLLSSGADANVLDVNGNTALLTAVSFHNFTVVELLLKYKADVNTGGSYPLLNTRGNVNAEQIKNGYTALHVAAYKSENSIVKILLSSGANINARLTDGTTALHISVVTGYENLNKLLKTRGAKINGKKNDGNNALRIADGKKEITNIETLLDSGADINAHLTDGTTALHISTETWWEDLVKLLIARGANLNAKKTCGTTALHIAVDSRENNIVKILLDSGADVNAQQTSGTTALHIAVNFRYKDFIRNLKTRGAFFSCQLGCEANVKHTNAMDSLSESGCRDLVQLLVTRGANVNAKDEDGNTALHTAVKGRHVDVVEYLLDNGALVNCQNENGDTPLSLAVKFDNCDILRVILKFGPDINLKDEYGRTQLEIACQEYSDVVNDLVNHIVKLHTANIYICDRNLEIISEIDFDDDLSSELYDLKNNTTELKKEVEAMKNEKICNASFYDILTESTNSLVKYMRNEKIVMILLLDEFETKFPMYADMIKMQFKKGMVRKKLIEQGNLFLNFLLNNIFEQRRIPENCSEKIIDYLSNEDLRIFINACESLGVRIPW